MNAASGSAAGVSRSTIFLDRIYDEAMRLLIEARNLAASARWQGRIDADAVGTLRVTRESLRLTAQLAHTMAWLLSHKAVDAGEITQEQRLAGFDALNTVGVCMAQDAAQPALPEELSALLARSGVLYQRVARIDTMMRAVEGPASGAPQGRRI